MMMIPSRRRLVAALGIFTLTASAVGAQQESAQRLAPPAVYQVAPGLGTFTDELLFEEVWERPQLAPRDRSLVTLATLVSTGKTEQVGGHVTRALDNGVKPEEIGEIITHLAFYSGWPNAISAVDEIQGVFAQRGIGPVRSSQAARLELKAAAEAARTEAINTTVAPTSPLLAELTNRVLFGDLWRRPDLSARDRSLITMAALVAGGQAEQLPFHANRAMDSGLTRTEVAEVPAQVAFYAGWPRAMSSIPVLEKVFASRTTLGAAPGEADLRVLRANPGGERTGPETTFTGRVRIGTIHEGDAPSRINAATVSFEAGARTYWHTHPAGQTLYIISGVGWVQKEGTPVTEVRPGDVVWIPPGVRHWHGASATEPMTHFAVHEAIDGNVVTWMEKVPDQAYRLGPAR